MREGRRERIGLLTKNQRELTIHAHEKLRDLQKRRDDIKLRSAERHSSILSNEPSELQKIQSELNKLSHAVSRLEYDVDLGISVIVQDLDVILSSEILKSWILKNIPTFNTITEKLEKLNALRMSRFNSYHKNRRVVMTNSRPKRYWLNENYFEDRKEKSRFISPINLDYVLQGIKRGWNRKYGNVIINVRFTLREALELEEKNPLSQYQRKKGRNILPRSENDAMSISEIHNIIEKVKNS